MIGGKHIGAHQQNHAEPMSEINTTPLVDVMLVLLVIFIITAPHSNLYYVFLLLLFILYCSATFSAVSPIASVP